MLTGLILLCTGAVCELIQTPIRSQLPLQCLSETMQFAASLNYVKNAVASGMTPVFKCPREKL